MEIGRRPATLLEFLSAATGAWFVAPYFCPQGRGHFALIEGLAVRQPVLVHGDYRLRNLQGEVATHGWRLGQSILLRHEVIFSQQANRPVDATLQPHPPPDLQPSLSP